MCEKQGTSDDSNVGFLEGVLQDLNDSEAKLQSLLCAFDLIAMDDELKVSSACDNSLKVFLATCNKYEIVGVKIFCAHEITFFGHPINSLSNKTVCTTLSCRPLNFLISL